MEVNGEQVGTVDLPSYPALGTVATTTENSVIVKIVNFGSAAEPVLITLDCDVEPDYSVALLTGNAEDENRIDAPQNVRDVLLQASGASRSFVYDAPGLSVSILTLRISGGE
ncbi:MAG: hypothetical protein IKG87_15405 [Clostridia bacterium]|nr:hypothetical protein [Clostridia bacterium]